MKKKIISILLVLTVLFFNISLAVEITKQNEIANEEEVVIDDENKDMGKSEDESISRIQENNETKKVDIVDNERVQSKISNEEQLYINLEENEKTIEDGEYKIRAVQDEEKIFDIQAGSNDSKAKLQIWNDCNVKQQRYFVKYLGNGFYRITARNSNKVLDVENGSVKEGARIQQYDDNGTDAQKWIIKKNKDNTYSIISKLNGLYITIPNSNVECGTELLMYKEKGDISQKFKFDKIEQKIGHKTIEDGTYEIRTALNNNMIFDIVAGSTESGAKLQIWEDADVSQQRFNIKYIGNGLYSIAVKKSNKALDVVNGIMENGNRIQQYDWNNTDAQKWIIKETENGRFNIISKGTGLYLTIENNEVKNGTKVLTYGKNENENQEFIFQEIKKEKGTKTIEDGDYEIRLASDNSKVFDIEDGSDQSQAKLQIWDDCDVLQQRYIVNYMGNGYYKISVKKSGKVLDVEGGGLDDGNKVQQYDNNDTDAQRWIIRENQDGTFFIISKRNDLYLTINNKNIECGNKVLMYGHKDEDYNQKFIFDKVVKVNGEKIIEDGEYKIRIAQDENKVFDIKGGSNNSQAKLQIWDDCNVKQQRYLIKYMGDGFYKITARNSSKVLDVEGGGLKEKTKIQQYDNNDTDAQKWIIKKNEDNTYSIISKCNGLYITIPDTEAQCGTELLMYKENDGMSQKFKLEKINQESGNRTIEDGTYEIRTSINKNMIFDITSGSMDSGAKLQIWEDADVAQQRFYIRYIGDGLYSITVKKSNKVLDVVNGVMQNGNRIQQYNWNNTDAQKWIIRETENGKFNIISKGTGLYLTVEKNEIQNGTRVLTYGKSGKENQEFTFEKVTELNGIDVSVYQGNIDWKAVKESGVDFAMIRVGYRGWGTGRIVYDSNYKYNLENALKNGIKCGVYFYTQAINEAEAREEADFIIDAIKQYNITYPVVIDSEESTTAKIGRADKLSVEERTRICDAFCKRVEERGYTGMIYASKYWFHFNLDMKKLSGYKIWLAHYTGSPENKTDYNGKYDIWQYTSKGNISGISGNVDLNIIF